MNNATRYKFAVYTYTASYFKCPLLLTSSFFYKIKKNIPLNTDKKEYNSFLSKVIIAV